MVDVKKSKTIEDKGLIDSLLFLKESKLWREYKSSVIFETVKEAEASSIEEVFSVVKEQLNNLKLDISFLQKRGFELHLESIRLLEVPLKLKVWRSTLLRKDLEKVFSLITSVSKVVDPLKKKEEDREAELDKSVSQKVVSSSEKKG